MSSRSFTGYPFTGRRFTGYPFTGVQFGEVIDGLDILALFYNGSIPYYTTYTRKDPAYTSAGTFAQDKPPYEIVDGKKRFVQYEGENLVPNPEDPELWSLQGGATHDAVSGYFTIPNGALVQFYIIISSGLENQPYSCRAEIEFISGENGRLTVQDGVDSNEEIFSTSCVCELLAVTGPTATRVNYYVRNRVSTPLVVKISKPQIENKPYLIPYIPVGNTPVNKGTTSLLAEDDGSELARLPWVSPLGTKYGVKGALNGVDGNPAIFSIPFTKYIPHALPEDIVVNGDFSSGTDDWTTGSGAVLSESGGDMTVQLSGGDSFGNAYQEIPVCEGCTYVFNTEIVSKSNVALSKIDRTATGADALISFDTVGVHSGLFKSTESGMYYAQLSTFGADSNAVFGYVQVAEAIVLLTDSNDNPILYIDPFDGLVKGYDGTNTCVSTAAATEGTTVSGWFSFNGPENEMWITLDGVKGSIATCLDALPDVGLRLYGLTAGTYQSIENLYIDNELPLQTGQGIWNTPLSAIKDNLLSDMWNTPLKEM